MGEGGMLCCHDVSLQVKVQEEGLNSAANPGQRHSPLPALWSAPGAAGADGAEVLHPPI